MLPNHQNMYLVTSRWKNLGFSLFITIFEPVHVGRCTEWNVVLTSLSTKPIQHPGIGSLQGRCSLYPSWRKWNMETHKDHGHHNSGGASNFRLIPKFNVFKHFWGYFPKKIFARSAREYVFLLFIIMLTPYFTISFNFSYVLGNITI